MATIAPVTSYQRKWVEEQTISLVKQENKKVQTFEALKFTFCVVVGNINSPGPSLINFP